jgi:hypothetical protein
MKRTGSRKITLVLGALLIFAGVASVRTVYIGQAGSTATPTETEEQLAQQVQAELKKLLDPLTGDDLCDNQQAIRDTYFQVLAHLISAPDAQTFSLRQIEAIFDENSGIDVGLVAGGTDYVLAYWLWFPSDCPHPSHALPGYVNYVISRSGGLWDVGWRIEDIYWVGDRWVARYNPTELSYAAWPSSVIHIEQQDGEWGGTSYIAYPPESAHSAALKSSLRVENLNTDGWQVVLSFARYHAAAPCDFQDGIDFYSSIEEVEITYKWDGTAYTTVGDEVMIRTVVIILVPDGHGGETYKTLDDWPTTCRE